MDKSRSFYSVGEKVPLLRLATEDFWSGLKNYQLWMFLGWQDIRQRYRRSVLGPLWLTLTTGVTIAMLGLLYGHLFKMPNDVYVPFLATGIIVWTFMVGLINEGCEAFMQSDMMIKQVRNPLSTYAFRTVWRNSIILAHNAVILIPVWWLFPKSLDLIGMLTVLLGLVVIAFNGVLISITLGALTTRFRDIGPIVTNIVQASFFITPIMWLPSLLQSKGVGAILIDLNPFFHLIEIVRSPLLGNDVSVNSWLYVLGISGANLAIALFVLGRFRYRIPYWL
ncbi:MAG: ABC transporter permease [Gammaproteobacteria bacterium]|nr:ABC transporter permease [Gammaproteobacteria bacterium]